MMLHLYISNTKALCLACSDMKIFFMFSLFKPKMLPWAGHFCPKGHNLNKLGKGPLHNATYQIPRL